MTDQDESTADQRLAAIDAFLCESGLLKAEDPDPDDALFLTPGGYWEPRECDDVGDHVDAIKRLLAWSHEAGYWDGVAATEQASDATPAEVARLHRWLERIRDYAKTSSQTSRKSASIACLRLYHVAGDAAQALNESRERMRERQRA